MNSGAITLSGLLSTEQRHNFPDDHIFYIFELGLSGLMQIYFLIAYCL